MSDVPFNGTSWRLTSLEQRVQKLEENKPDVVAERVGNHAIEMREIRDEISSLKRALYTFALSITASAVAFGIGVLLIVR